VPRRGPAGLALAVLAGVSGWLAVRPEASAAPVEVASRPLWSPERLPGLVAEATGAVELAEAVDDVLDDVPSSCLVAYQGGREIFSRRADSALVPASTQKILIGAAAVARLGADYRFTTKVVAGAPVADGVADRLWLVGGGDPFLVTPELALQLSETPHRAGRRPTLLDDLAGRVAEAGIRHVPGGIAGDDSRYDRERSVPSWKPGYISQNQVGPLGALLVDSGFTDTVPPLARALDPAAHAATQLSRLLAARGVTVPAPATSGRAPDDAVTVAEIRSPPLEQVVSAMIRESDNTAAELLVRELGHVAAGEGSTPAGLRVVVDQLSELGLPTDGLRLGDGSGLEATNQVTCALLAATLDRVDGIRKWLATAGETGTLSRRFLDTPLEGRLQAKTGQLNGVTGLTGFVDGRRDLRFAFLANGRFGTETGRALQDRLLGYLANYPAPPGDG
jgi:D-alanyl-D-alanine carboxypeptidase/D-alanyl-D-alanine-endopeptidase (penicillin-binding protein 4)